MKFRFVSPLDDEINRALEIARRHGSHNQESHGNWAKGTNTGMDEALSAGVQAFKAKEAAAKYQPIGSSTEDYNLAMKEHTPKNVEANEVIAVQRYKNGAYKHVNAKLRGQPTPSMETLPPTSNPEEKIQWYSDNMRSVVDKAPTLQKDTILYRGYDKKDTFARDLKQGQVFEEPAFMSTAMREREASNFADTDGTMFELQVPKGTKALSVDGVLDEAGKEIFDEWEMVLPPGTAWEVKGITKGRRNQRVLTLELIDGGT